MLKFLLDEACFSPDAMATLPNYMVALHVAVLGNSVWAAVMLLDRGANAAIRNVSSRETPIDLALRLRNVAVATALFSRGAVYSEDSRVMREGQDFLLDARLHVAAMLNRPDAIQALLESGQLEADARVKGGFTAAHLAALFGVF